MTANNKDQSFFDVQRGYEERFSGLEEFRVEMWKVLCRNFICKYIPGDSVLLEIAAGHCEFINAAEAGRKIAVDINEATKRFARPEVEVHITSSSDLSVLENESIDVVWVSNFFEHIGKPEIVATLRAIRQVLKANGKVLVLQPNIRYVGQSYWMFFDHITPLDHDSVCEVLKNTGYKVDVCIPRFLPYTTKGRAPRSITLLKLYLKLPFLWRFFGGQCFVVASKQEYGTQGEAE